MTKRAANKIPEVPKMEFGPTSETDFEEVGPLSLSDKVKITHIPPQKNPISLTNIQRGWGSWSPPEFNFLEIIRVAEIESIVTQAFAKKESLMFKEGWEIVSSNQQVADYVRTRLREMEQVSEISTHDLIRGLGTGLIRVSNSFAALYRNKNKSSGKIRVVKTYRGEKVLQPIAGIYPIPIETIEFKRDKQTARIIALRQTHNLAEGAKEKEFYKDNYLHFKINERDGISVGVPTLVPVIPDIRALRRLEENVEYMLYSQLQALYHYTVGNKDHPNFARYQDGADEISVAESQFKELPSDGAIVTPWWHKIDVVGAKNQSLDPIPFLEYYKARVIAGAAISQMDLGDGSTANRSTGDNLSRILIDGVKYIQRRLEKQFFQFVIWPLLLESVFDPDMLLRPENQVKLVFKEIDVDYQIKKENHAAQLFAQHAINLPELREAVGHDSYTEDEWKETFFKKIEESMALLKQTGDGTGPAADALSRIPSSEISPQDIAKAKAKEQTKQQAVAKTLAQGDIKPNRGQRAGTAVDRPSNQYGTKLGPDGRKSSFSPLIDIWEQALRISKELDSGQEQVGNFIRSHILAEVSLLVSDKQEQTTMMKRVNKELDSMVLKIKKQEKPIPAILDSSRYFIESIFQNYGGKE